MEGSGGTSERRSQPPVTRTYPLNSRRLTARSITKIAEALGLPTSATLADTRQIIEGKLTEESHEPRNVEVVVTETEGETTIRLQDEGGVIVEIPVEEEGRASPTTSETEAGAEPAVRDSHDGLTTNGGGGPGDDEVETSRALGELRTELESARVRVTALESELESVQERAVEEATRLQQEVSQLEERVRGERERYSALWRMNCERLLEHDEIIATKEEENDRLRAHIAELEAMPRHSIEHEYVPVAVVEPPPHDSPRTDIDSRGRSRASVASDPVSGARALRMTPGRTHTPLTSITVVKAGARTGPLRARREGHLREASPRPPSRSSRDSETEREGPQPRRGKAPPVDAFTGESPDILFDDWFPALQRAAEWNGWGHSETLIQLAGHLRGRALQEWGLLSASDKSTLERAMTAMRNRLDPCSRTLAAQDFRHAAQRRGEPVADFIRRLEQTFKLAYGRDKMSDETRETLLHSQLQEGLLYELMKAPAVSGSHGYPELCLAA